MIDVDESEGDQEPSEHHRGECRPPEAELPGDGRAQHPAQGLHQRVANADRLAAMGATPAERSEEHTSELQSRLHLVCRLLLEKKKHRQRRLDHLLSPGRYFGVQVGGFPDVLLRRFIWGSCQIDPQLPMPTVFHWSRSPEWPL